MLYKILLLNLLLLLSILTACREQKDSVHSEWSLDPVELVNPFVDTHDSRWFYFSSASRPFGMVNLSPDTDTDKSWSSGYLYGSKQIRCLSHIHAWQMSGIAVLPATGKVRGHMGMDEYQSDFDHDGEIADPGYHKLYLKSYDIEVELTSTTRVGFHRYHFNRKDNPHILFDLGAYLAHCPTTDTYARVVSDTRVEGYTVMAPTFRRIKPVRVYFVAQLDRSIEKTSGWKDSTLLQDPVSEISGQGTGLVLSLSDDTEQVLMKVAISYTSLDNARLNMETELPHWDFDRVRKESYEDWRNWLSRIRVDGGTRQQQVKFYTDLWRALQGRRIVSDVNGEYIDNTGDEPVVRRVRTDGDKPVFPHYNFDGWWGSHFTLNILWSLAYPEIVDGFCNTMVDMYRNGGLVPRGSSGGNYTFVMIGDPATPFFACAHNKGINNYDMSKAYEGLRKNAFEGGIRDRAGYEWEEPIIGGGMNYYVEQGWIPEGIEPGHRAFHCAGASMTLEYAYQDWCLAQLSKKLRKTDDYEMFMKRSKNYEHLWNPETGLMHPREKDGSWIPDFNPIAEERHTRGFCESNSAVYTHFVPHDVSGLAYLFGGNDAYNKALNEQFEKAASLGFTARTKKLHASNWVDYGNEPGQGMAHRFNHSGAPWLAQKWVREVKKALNDTTPYGGYNGDEDQGKGGAIGVLMAIGLYQVDGGASAEPYYEITSPVFDRVEIDLNPDYYPGRTFIITAKNNGPENMYISSASLNGQNWNQCWFYHRDLIKGGHLDLELTDTPDREWGVTPLPPGFDGKPETP